MGHLVLLPSYIDSGDLATWAGRVEACRVTIEKNIRGDGEIEKLDYMASLCRRASGQFACVERILQCLFAASKYYGVVAELRGRFGGAVISELFSPEADA